MAFPSLRLPQRPAASWEPHHGARWKNCSRSGWAAGWTLGQAARPWTLQDLLHYNLRGQRGRAAAGEPKWSGMGSGEGMRQSPQDTEASPGRDTRADPGRDTGRWQHPPGPPHRCPGASGCLLPVPQPGEEGMLSAGVVTTIVSHY